MPWNLCRTDCNKCSSMALDFCATKISCCLGKRAWYPPRKLRRKGTVRTDCMDLDFCAVRPRNLCRVWTILNAVHLLGKCAQNFPQFLCLPNRTVRMPWDACQICTSPRKSCSLEKLSSSKFVPLLSSLSSLFFSQEWSKTCLSLAFLSEP